MFVKKRVDDNTGTAPSLNGRRPAGYLSAARAVFDEVHGGFINNDSCRQANTKCRRKHEQIRLLSEPASTVTMR